jgi:hypothetical protein
LNIKRRSNTNLGKYLRKCLFIKIFFDNRFSDFICDTFYSNVFNEYCDWECSTKVTKISYKCSIKESEWKIQREITKYTYLNIKRRSNTNLGKYLRKCLFIVTYIKKLTGKLKLRSHNDFGIVPIVWFYFYFSFYYNTSYCLISSGR